MKNVTRASHHKPSGLAMIERMHAWWTIAIDGSYRLRGDPPYHLEPDQNYFTSNVVGGNMYTDALSKYLMGYFQVGNVALHEDRFAIAYWDAVNLTFTIGPTLSDQDGTHYDGTRPIPVQIIDDGEGVRVDEAHGTYVGWYIVIQSSALENGDVAGGAILHAYSWEDPITNRVNFDDWVMRSATDVPMDDGSNFGWGQDVSFHDTLDLVHHDPSAVPLWPTSTFPDKHDIAPNAPGYGHVWYGWPKQLFFHNSRWYCLCRGYVLDREADPINGAPPYYAANALWRLNAGENPDNNNAWRLMDAWASYDIDHAYNVMGEAAPDHNSPHFWVEQFAGCTFFSAPPVLPLHSDFIPDSAESFDTTAVFCMQGGVLHKSFAFPDDSCWGGPMAQMGGNLFFPVISTAEQRIYLYRLDALPDSWVLVSDFPITVSVEVAGSHPLISTAFGINGRVHVVYGRAPTIWNHNPIPETDGPGTAYKMISWRQSGNTWLSLSGGAPAPYWSDNDFGLWPRLWQIKPDVTPVGGGGGGTGVGACDDVFSIYAASTISRAVFAAQLDGSATIYGSSPLLAENADPDFWYDKIVSYGIDPNFALAMWFKETKYGTVMGELGSSARNIGNLRPHSWGHGSTTNPARIIGTSHFGSFQTYSTWLAGVEDYCQLWSLSIYSGKTISEAIAIYAPRSENNTDLYISQVCTFMTDRAAESV